MKAWLPAVLICAFSLAPAPGTSEAHAQDVEASTCSSCSVELVRTAVIPADADGVAIAVPLARVAFSRGSFVFARTYDGTIATWKNGRMSSIGRRGNGPREVPNDQPFTSAVTADGEVLLPFGRQLVRVAAGGDSILEQGRLPFGPAALYTVGNSVFITGIGSASLTPVFTEGRRGPPLRTGLVVDRYSILQASASGDSALWVATPYEYRAVLLTPEGRKLLDVRREPRWFRSDGYAGPPHRVRPVPQILGVREYSTGILLFHFSVADHDWEPGPVTGVRMDQMDWNGTFDTVLQFVDTNTSQLIASVRYDQFLWPVDGSPFYWSAYTASSGDEHFMILQPVLRR